MGKIKTHISGFSSWHHLLFTEFAKLFAETEKINFLLIMPPVHCETMSNRFVGVAALLSKNHCTITLPEAQQNQKLSPLLN